MKESSQPKALNILRPNQVISSAKSTTSSTSNVIPNRKPRVTTYISTNNDKPSLNIYHPPQKTSRTSYNEKLKNKKSSSSINSSVISNSSVHSQHYPYTSSTVSSNSHYLPNNNNINNNNNIQKDRPTIEIYKPGTAQLQRSNYPKPSSMTKSYTAPIIVPTTNTFNNGNNGSSSNNSGNVTTNINSTNSNINSNSNINNKTNNNKNNKHYTTAATQSHQTYRSINNSNSQLYHTTTNSNNYSSISIDHQIAITSPTKISISQSSSTSTLSSESSQKSHLKQQSINNTGYSSTEDENQEEDDNNSQSSQSSHEENILNEARVNRKIADLEISNQSLLAVNAMLESTVKKQASEMAKLKKRIQFGKCETNSEGSNVLLDSNELVQPLPNSDLSEDEWENDKSFQRLCRMTDSLIEQAQLAINFEYKGAGRVISVYSNDDGNYTADDNHE